MKTMSYLTGNILFAGNVNFKPDVSIRIIINDVTIANSKEQVYEHKVDFDPDSLAIFKYLPFELKDFEHDPTRRYGLSVHVDMNDSGQVERGDYVAEQDYPVVTALEEINVQLIQVP